MKSNAATTDSKPSWPMFALPLFMTGLIGCQEKVRLATIEAAVRKGNLPAANRMIDAYVLEHPSERDGLLLQARLAEASHDPLRAVDALSRLIQHSPEGAELQRRYGLALLASSQYEQAEAAFWEVLCLQPNDEAAQTELQWILFHQLRERELEAFLEACLAREPGQQRLLYHLLVSSQKRPNPHESMPVLEKIDQTCPDQRSVVLGLARCAWKLGEIEPARRLFERAIALGEPDLELALTLAEFELEQVNPDGVSAALAATPGITQDRWQAIDRYWWLQSQLSLQRGDLEAALAAVTDACRLYPRSLPYLHSRASLLRLLGHVEAAAALQTEVDARRNADQRLYVVVQSGELDRPSAALLREIAGLCDIQKKTLQAQGWRILADRFRP